MDSSQFVRLEMLVGKEGISKLKNARVCVFGTGGVGGYVCEALCRAGIGTIDIVDNDTVALSNLNRQIIALHSTVGQYKTDVCEARLHDINPDVKINKHTMFFLPENSNSFDFSLYDYVVDAIDTVSAKLEIVKKAKQAGVPVISCMGTGNKLDPTKLVVTDIYKTKDCPLARIMRALCRKNGIDSLKVVYSTEKALKPLFVPEENGELPKKSIPASSPFVPSAAGLIIAATVTRELLEE